MQSLTRACGALALAALLGPGCADETPDPIYLEVTTEPGAEGPVDLLRVWIKSESGGVRRTQTDQGQPGNIAIPPDVNVEIEPFRVSLEPAGPDQPTFLYVHLAAYAGDTPVGTADLKLPLGSGVLVRKVTLVTWRADCDRDGDTFLDCSQSDCCDDLPPSLRSTFTDCLDDPGLVAVRTAGRECRGVSQRAAEAARASHPFRPSSYDASLDHCEDCIDQDCAGGDAICDFPDGDGDTHHPPFDCDDTNRSIYPGAVETCGDGIDENCNSVEGIDPDGRCPDDVIDADPDDLDGDGYNAKPVGGQDCDDRDAGRNPGLEEICEDEIDQDCDNEDLECPVNDLDGDGHVSRAAGGDDCDDDDAQAFPGAPERCGDDIDQDCDGRDPGCALDRDGDAYLAGAGDCDDTEIRIRPLAREVCNGLDDDCDGLVDEGNPLILGWDGVELPKSCYEADEATRDVGRCVAGNRVCTRAFEGVPRLFCSGQRMPRPETCSRQNEGGDDDCDGIEDNVPGRDSACDTGLLGACRDGHLDCVDEALTCVQNLPDAPDEACDGIDRDCNGTGDGEEILLPWHSGVCFDGVGLPGVGRCEAGRHACQGERYGPCVGQVLEVPETCANEGEDSNCDNVLDNIPGRGEACNTGVPGVCASGQRQCGPDAEAPICVQTILPVDETCNGQDMDCDGQVDEDFRRRGRRCGRGNQFPPQCRNGRWVCNNGREVCDLDRTGLPDTDVTCNGVDEDCDGQTDEEWVAEACNSRLRGICAEGVEVCDIPGGERCAPVREPAAEDACAEDGTGNGIDENCNDQVDEGCL